MFVLNVENWKFILVQIMGNYHEKQSFIISNNWIQYILTYIIFLLFQEIILIYGIEMRQLLVNVQSSHQLFQNMLIFVV